MKHVLAIAFVCLTVYLPVGFTVALASAQGVGKNEMLNKPIEKKLNVEVKFEGFTVTFKGDVHKPQPPGGPTIGPTSRAFFLVKEDLGKEQELSIFVGQTPPGPEKFRIGKKKYVLLTFKTTKGERLYPSLFQVEIDKSIDTAESDSRLIEKPIYPDKLLKPKSKP